MKTWYCVTSTYDDHGRVTAGITDTKRAEEKPENGYTSKRDKDIYTDWFGSHEEAAKFVEEARIA